MVHHDELHVISTGQQTSDQLIEIISYIHHDIDFIHLREKTWTANEYITVIQSLSEYGVPLEKIIVNDRIDVAHVMNCGGVQLAHHSIDVHLLAGKYDNLRIGCSVHSVADAIEIEASGADYLLYGHIFDTRSKPGLSPRGLENLASIIESVTIPVIAIGGITPENVESVIHAGASGIAVLSGVLLATDPYEAVQIYRQKLNKGGLK